MDFSTRNMVNYEMIQKLREQNDISMDEISSKHVDRAESNQMIKEVFPPEEFGYKDLKGMQSI